MRRLLASTVRSRGWHPRFLRSGGFQPPIWVLRSGGFQPPNRGLEAPATRRWSSLESRRAAFTLIELLVTLAVIAILVAIAVPAVMSMRESSRRMECASKLKQFGLALQNFEAARGHYPVGYGVFSAPTPGALKNVYSPIVYLLPYLDQAPLYHKIDLQRGVGFDITPYPVGIADQILPVLLCPSDANVFGTNYRFCTGASAYDHDHHYPKDCGKGVFHYYKSESPRSITDGLSHTIGMSEKLKSTTPDAWRPREHFWYSGVSSLLGSPDTDVVVQVCASLSSPPAQFGWYAGNGWMLGKYEFTLYNHSVPPNASIPDCSIHSYFLSSVGGGGGVFAARSYHAGGVNCLLMDGSSRFVSQSIDLAVWRALATIAGGETIGEW